MCVCECVRVLIFNKKAQSFKTRAQHYTIHFGRIQLAKTLPHLGNDAVNVCSAIILDERPIDTLEGED